MIMMILLIPSGLQLKCDVLAKHFRKNSRNLKMSTPESWKSQITRCRHLNTKTGVSRTPRLSMYFRVSGAPELLPRLVNPLSVFGGSTRAFVHSSFALGFIPDCCPDELLQSSLIPLSSSPSPVGCASRFKQEGFKWQSWWSGEAKRCLPASIVCRVELLIQHPERCDSWLSMSVRRAQDEFIWPQRSDGTVFWGLCPRSGELHRSKAPQSPGLDSRELRFLGRFESGRATNALERGHHTQEDSGSIRRNSVSGFAFTRTFGLSTTKVSHGFENPDHWRFYRIHGWRSRFSFFILCEFIC